MEYERRADRPNLHIYVKLFGGYVVNRAKESYNS